MIAYQTKSIIYVLLILLSLLPGVIYSQISIGENHPELNWHVHETEHFTIIYHQGIETFAAEAARIAEYIYGPITTELGIEPDHKTPIIISDYEDYSNGLSTPLGHYIFIWAKSYPKYTTGPNRWLPEVIAHEFVHQLNFWSVRGFPGFWRELLALGFMPTWFIEGLAQYQAEQWDEHREVLLRIATMNDALLPVKKLAGFISTNQVDARLVYEQGHSLVRYIAAKYGKEKIRAIIKKHRSFPFRFDFALKKTIGKSQSALFDEWKAEITQTYQSNWKISQSMNQIAARIPIDLQGVSSCRWSPDGSRIAVVGVEDFDEEVPRLYVYDIAGKNKRVLAQPYVGAFFSWSPDSRHIVYTKNRKGRHGSLINDLFIIDVNSRQEQALTHSLRASDPDWSPDGSSIVYSYHQGPFSNLAIYDLHSRTSRVVTKFGHWTEAFTPAWSLDGSQIAFSLFDEHGQRDLALIQPDGTHFQKLTDDIIDDRFPAWSPDGNAIAFISYQNGNPNLFIKNLITKEIRQITNVPGAVFHPAYLPDGDEISIIAIEAPDHVAAYRVKLTELQPIEADKNPPFDHISWHQTTPAYYDTLYPQKYEPASSKKRHRYQSFLEIRPQLTIPFYGEDDAGYQPGILNLSADPLGKHTILWSIAHRRRTHFWVNYNNKQFMPTMSLAINKTTIDNGNYIFVNNRSLDLWEEFWSAALTFSVPFNFGASVLSNHLLYLRGLVSNRRPLDPEKFTIIKEKFRPFSGWINTITVGYNYESYRPDIAFRIHPKTGVSLSLNYRHSGKLLQSDLVYDEVNVGFIYRQKIPFNEWIVATRISAVAHQGQQPLQSLLSIGGVALRGADRSMVGDRLVSTNLEIRLPLFTDLGLNLWILYLERLCGAYYFDVGTAWGTNRNTYVTGAKKLWRNAVWLKTTGVLLRQRVYLFGKIPVVLHGGLGIPLPNSDNPQLFYGIEEAF